MTTSDQRPPRLPRPPRLRIPPPRSQTRRGLRRFVVGAVAIALVGVAVGSLAIATDALGAGQRWESVVARVERFIAGPVPDRPTVATVRVTEPPAAALPTISPTTAPTASAEPGTTPIPTVAPAPTPSPTPEPVRAPVEFTITDDPEAFFASQVHKDWCTPAALQIVLALHGLVNTGRRTQEEIAGRVREWESLSDSRNGDWGPGAMALALEAYGVPGYEVRAFETRQGALRDSARAIQATGAPVILLAWRGAHTWVMSGFRADADPTVFRDAHIDGGYILDPWYPRISSLWGPSDPAGTFQDGSEMERNFLPWKRPEGRYPDRDGLYLTVAPTVPISPPAG